MDYFFHWCVLLSNGVGLFNGGAYVIFDRKLVSPVYQRTRVFHGEQSGLHFSDSRCNGIQRRLFPVLDIYCVCAIPINNLLGFGDRSKHNQSRTKVKRKRHTRLFTRWTSPHSSNVENPKRTGPERFPEIHYICVMNKSLYNHLTLPTFLYLNRISLSTHLFFLL